MDPLEAVFGAKSGEQEATYFERSDEVAEVAEQLLGKHLLLARLREVSIAYLLQQGTDPQQGKSREATIDTIAKAVKAPPLWQELANVLAVVWVNGRAWSALGTRQREAVVLHELLHLDVDKTGKLVLLKHDVEEFTYVVAHYGPWHGGLERFGEQMGLWGAHRAGDGLQQVANEMGAAITLKAGGKEATLEPHPGKKRAEG